MMGETDERAADLEASVEAARSRALTGRLRLLIGATVGIVLAFILFNPAVRSGPTAPYFALRLMALAALGAFFVETYRPSFAAHQTWWAIALATGIAALSTRGGILRGDLAVLATLHIILVLSVAAVLPWGLRAQAIQVAICALLMMVAVFAIGVPSSGDTGVLVLINVGAGLFLSLFIAYQTRKEFDRAVRENLRLRAAEERNRTWNEELEGKVRARTAELEGALADQRAVTRAISHDLRQPLRHIEGYARMLEDDLGARLDAGNLDRLDRVRMSTVRMGRMVDALLEFSRVSGRLLQRRTVNMSDCVSELCADLVRAEPERRVEFAIELGLAEECDPDLTRDLLRELLANAWKFTREQAAARIEFGRRGQAWFVRDNGTGFDMHHVAEFEGEGMGLAIAERIVRSHGGRIWAESEPTRGATFLFTLQSEV
jgi:signal transduction histidine kinase